MDNRFEFTVAIGKALEGVAQLGNAFKGMFASVKKEAEKADDAFAGMSVDEVKQKIAQLNAEIGKLSSRDDIVKKQAEIEALNGKLTELVGTARDAAEGGDGGGIFGSVFGGTLVAGLAAKGMEMVGGAIAGVQNAMIGGNAEMETYITQFSTLLGSTEAAKAKLEELAAFGAATPFELPEIARAEKVLVSFGLTGERAMEMTGRSAEEFRTIVGDIAAGTGASFEEISLNMGKFSAGNSGEVLARFAELGIVTKQELKKMGIEFAKSGELLSPLPDAMQAITKITAEKFGGGMAALSATFDGLKGTFNDQIAEIGRTIGAPFFDAAKAGLIGVMDLLGSPAVQGAVGALGAAFKGLFGFMAENKGVATALVLTIGSLAAVMGYAAIAAMLETKMLALKTLATTIATTATAALSATMWGLPIGWIIGGIGLVVGGLMLLYNNVKPVRDAISILGDIVGGAFRLAWDGIVAVFSAVWSALQPVVDVLMAVGNVIFQFVILPWRIAYEVIAKVISIVRGWIDALKGGTASTSGFGKVIAWIGGVFKTVFGPAIAVATSIVNVFIDAAKSVVEWVTKAADALANFSLFGDDDPKARAEADAAAKAEAEKRAAEQAEAAAKERFANEKKILDDALNAEVTAIAKAADKGTLARKDATIARLRAEEEYFQKLIAAAEKNGQDITEIEQKYQAKRAERVTANAVETEIDEKEKRIKEIGAQLQRGTSRAEMQKLRAEALALQKDIDKMQKDVDFVTGKTEKPKSTKDPKSELADQKKLDDAKLAEAEKAAIREAKAREASAIEIAEIEQSFLKLRTDADAAYYSRLTQLSKAGADRKKAELAEEENRIKAAGTLAQKQFDIDQMRKGEADALEGVRRKAAEEDATRLLAIQAEAAQASLDNERQKIEMALALRQAIGEDDPITALRAEQDARAALSAIELAAIDQKIEAMQRETAETVRQLELERERTTDAVKRAELEAQIAAARADSQKGIADATRERATTEAKIEGDLAVQKVDMDKAVQGQKHQVAMDAWTTMKGIAGEQSDVGKAMAIAETTMNTYSSATAAYASAAAIPIVGWILGPIAAAAAIAAGIANVNAIASTPTALADGGVLNKPTFVAGEAGAEVVAPLRALPGLMAASLQEAFGERTAPVNKRPGRGETVDANVHLSTSAVARQERRARISRSARYS